MASFVDQALEEFLKGSLRKFQDHLKQAGFEKASLNAQMLGARRFVAFLFGQTPKKRRLRF
jgi:hypothetical protein